MTDDTARVDGAAFRHALHASMTAMRRAIAAVPMTGDPDQDFLSMMIPHHEGAVEMARLVLVHGRDPLVRQLADEIIAGQQAEIISMKGRLAALRAGHERDLSAYPSLSGTRGSPPRP
jgi:uncharacterized protein (DUF305 family)